MQKFNVVLGLVASCAILVAYERDALGQGFGDYVAPPTSDQLVNSQQNANLGIPVQSVETAREAGLATVRPSAQPGAANALNTQRVNNTAAVAQQPAAQQRPVQPVAQQQIPANLTSHAAAPSAPQGGYVASEKVDSAIVPPPEDYKPTEASQAKLDQFLQKWENFGKGIKRISCDVHMREFDGVLQTQDSKRPVAHTWGQFRYISPNKLMYHIRGEFVYPEGKENGEWKESQNEWKIVLNSKELVQYDYKNKKVVVYPIAEEEQDMDLTMDNGQFPLFFVAKANVLKSRFYLQIITPAKRQQDQVWIEAFPRYARDASQFKSITVILDLKTLQPTYMRKLGVNGKSKTDLTFENVTVNKGLWTIDGGVEPGWTKDVREEKFSIMRQAPIEPEVVAQQPQPRQNALAAQNQNPQTRQAAYGNPALAQRANTAVNANQVATGQQRQLAPNASATRPATNATPRY